MTPRLPGVAPRKAVRALPEDSNVETLDVALWRIESEISKAIAAGALQENVDPAAPIDPDELEADQPNDD